MFLSPHPSVEAGARDRVFACDWPRIGVVEEGGGGGRMKEDEWNINCDAVDVAFKLRLPPEITLDIGARLPDNKIKT